MPENSPHHDRQDEAVRRRLAEARHTDPVPAEVAARLEMTLAGLVAERGAGAEVVPLRRRRWPAVLAAAAAVTALGFALPTLTGDDDSTHQMADKGVTAESAAGPWSRDTLAELGYTKLREVPVATTAGLDALAESPYAADQENGYQLDGGRMPMDSPAPSESRDLGKVLQDTPRNRSTASSAQACGPATVAPGVRLFTARSDGHRVLIARHRPTADGVLVEVYDCAGKDPATPAETFTLPPAE